MLAASMGLRGASLEFADTTKRPVIGGYEPQMQTCFKGGKPLKPTEA